MSRLAAGSLLWRVPELRRRVGWRDRWTEVGGRLQLEARTLRSAILPGGNFRQESRESPRLCCRSLSSIGMEPGQTSSGWMSINGACRGFRQDSACPASLRFWDGQKKWGPQLNMKSSVMVHVNYRISERGAHCQACYLAISIWFPEKAENVIFYSTGYFLKLLS